MALEATSNLPPADLRRWPIPPATLNRLPKEVAQEFDAVFYDESADFLYLGLAHPELLKESAQAALAALEQQLGKKIILTTISRTDLDRALALYDQQDLPQTNVATGEEWPPNWHSGDPVDDALLTMLPAEFCETRRILPVAFSEPATLWLGTDRQEKDVAALAELLGRRNRVAVKVVTLVRAEFSRILDLIKAATPLEPLPSSEPAAADNEPADEPSEEEVVRQGPEGLIVPKIAGRIISGDVEKSGLTGLLQKASLMIQKPEEAAPVAPPVKEPEKEVAGEKPAPPPVKLAVPPAPGEQPPDQPAPDRADVDQAKSKPEVSVDEKPPVEEKPAPVPLPPPPPSPTPDKAISVPKVTRQGVMDAEEDPGTPAARGDSFSRPVTDLKQLESIVRQGNIIRIVGAIINLAAHRRASDVHIEPYGDELVVRYRVDGQLGEVIKVPMELHPPVVSRIKILSKLKLDETRVPQDGRFDAVMDGDKEVDVRVSTLPTVHGEKVVMRLLDKSSGIITLENLGLKGDGFDRLVKAITRTYGVVLSTGPTGSGKTTTLYAVLERVATTNVNVVTLEDPVEYEIRGINQSQIKPKIGFTFAEGLRSILRQDPNIIMVGEVRDGETASMVTHAALTGHLVLSTLHTNDAAGALPRLTNMGIEPFLITSAMNAVIGQRLVRRLDPETKERVELPSSVRKEIDEELEVIRRINPNEAKRVPEKVEFFRPRPSEGSATGYKGRVGLYEVMLMNESIEELAVRKATADEIKDAAVKSGMITMRQDGILKVLEGVTSIDEVWHETSNR